MEEAIKPKRVRKPKNTQALEIDTTSTISDAELNAFLAKMIKQSQEPFYLKIWNGFLAVITFIFQTIAVIFAFIVGLGGCLLEFLWIAIAFILGWWILTGLYNWIF